MFDLMKLPMAAPMTVAFHARIKIAPAPYTKENRIENASTLKLLKNIFQNAFRLCITFPETWLLIDCIVPTCLSNRLLSVVVGRKAYHTAHATVMPTNIYIKNEIALLCSFNIAVSLSIIMSLLS